VELEKLHKKPNRLIKAYKLLNKNGNSIFGWDIGKRKSTQRDIWGPGVIFPSIMKNKTVKKQVCFDEIKGAGCDHRTRKGLYVFRKRTDALRHKIRGEKIVCVYVSLSDVVFANEETLVCSRVEINKEDWKKTFKINRKPTTRFV